MLRRILLMLTFRNPANSCYINTAVKGMFWAQLCTMEGAAKHWGAKRHLLQSFMLAQRGFSQPVLISDTTWGQDLLTKWELAAQENAIGQADVAEFTATLLNWISSNGWQWEQRYMDHATHTVRVTDQGNTRHPLTLHMDQPYPSSRKLPLTYLLDHWHQDQAGHCTALRQAPDIVCLHIERWVNPDGQLQLVNCGLLIPNMVDMPVFTNDGVTCEKHTYIPMVLTAHLGMDQAGHYVSALRFMQHNGQTAWMLRDDSFSPKPCTKLPKVFSQGINMLWLVHDQHSLIHMHPPPEWHQILQLQTVTT